MKNLLLILFSACLSFNYTLGQDPSILSYDSNTICANNYWLQKAISNLKFDSPNGDSIYIVSVDYPTAVFNSEQFTLDPVTETYSIELNLSVTPGAPGTYYIDVYYSFDGGDEFTESIPVTIAEIPNVTTDPTSLCDNTEYFDFNSLVSPKGGSFIIYPIESNNTDGIINVKEILDEYGQAFFLSYEYVYEDEYGCVYYQPSVDIEILTSPEITIDNITKSSCGINSGKIETQVSTQSLTYDSYWNNGVQNQNTIGGLSSGDYFYTVIDSSGCKSQASATVETTGFEVSGNITNVKCKGDSDGEISISVLGGSGNYKIHWSNGKGATKVTGLSAGMYSVKVIDMDNGCSAYKNFEVKEPENAFEGYFYENYPSTCTANDGAIYEFQGYDGTPPYSFQWNNGQTTDSLSNLSVGVYSVVITDSNGCKATYETIMNYYYDAPYTYADLVYPVCGKNNGSISLVEVYPTAGEEITSYLWSNGEETRNIDGLSPGEYTVTLTQSDGCSGFYKFDLERIKYDYTPEICIVTVDTATNTNLVVWEKELSNPNKIDYYKIYRANATSGAYQLIDTVDFANISVFNDVVASPEVRSWMYKISAVNTCGQESRLSKHHKTIHLVMNDGAVPEEKILTWDHYEGLEFFYYNLYRGTNVDGWQLIEGNIPITKLPSFSDMTPTGASEVDYIVEVVPTTGGCTATFGKAQDYNSSRSNKPSPIFEPGNGTGDPSNSLLTYDNNEFKAIVYPNPSNGNFKVDITNNINNHNLSMTVMGVNGKLIHQQPLNNELNSIQLNVRPGIYFVQIQGGNTVENIRIVVQ